MTGRDDRPAAWRRLSWLALGVVAAAALTIGSTGGGGPRTEIERVDHIAARLRCPTCEGLSARDSDAPSARALREEVARRVHDGESDTQIVGYVVSRYGPEILRDPPKEGVGLVVWVLPLVAAAVATGGLVVAFRRWRPRRRPVSEDDRALVEEALGRSSR